MLRDSAVGLITQRLGNRSDLTAHAIAEMQLVQTELEGGELLPWFLTSPITGVDTIPGDERVALPADFLREMEEDETSLWRHSGTELIELPKEDYSRLVAKYGQGLGAPMKYAVTGGYLRLRPIPDTYYTLSMIYYQKDPVLDSNIENNWLREVPDLLIAITGQRLAAYTQNANVIALFQSDEVKARNRLIIMDTARKEASRRRSMGED